MEFTDLTRFLPVKNPVVAPFEKLRRLKPVWMTQDLKIFDDENRAYAETLASQGMGVIKIQRKPPFERFLHRQDFPRRVLFEMTSNCNFLCRMCPQQNLKRPRMDMDGRLYRRVIDEIDTHGIEGFWMYHLGESLIHPEFEANLRHISTKKNLGVIWMSTNGEFLDEKKARTVLDSNIDYINFSAHAVTKGTYETVAPQGKFEIVQANLARLYEMKGRGKKLRKPFIHCQMIEQETTRHECDAFILKHYKKAEIVSINMLEYVNLPNNKFGFKQRTRPKLTNCTRILRNDCFICSNGDVTLCDAAYNGEILLGNVAKQTLQEIWTGEKRKQILELNAKGEMFKNEFCLTCSDYDI
jgi:radical SAM protein with 4Fe4S-binding SPASM domain